MIVLTKIKFIVTKIRMMKMKMKLGGFISPNPNLKMKKTMILVKKLRLKPLPKATKKKIDVNIKYDINKGFIKLYTIL